METNLQRIQRMGTKEFLHTVFDIMNVPYSIYVDYEAWLDSDNENLMDFVRCIGRVLVQPTDVEIAGFRCQTINQTGKSPTEKEINEYIKTHLKEYMLVGRTQVAGRPYVILTDIDTGVINKVPLDNIVSDKVRDYETDYEEPSSALYKGGAFDYSDYA